MIILMEMVKLYLKILGEREFGFFYFIQSQLFWIHPYVYAFCYQIVINTVKNQTEA